jgi:hypothetical protein
MKNLKYLFGIFSICVLLFNISCQRTVTNSVVEKLRIDTVRDYKVITKYDAVHDTLTVDNPCDSAGILTTFYSKIKIPQGQVIIRSVRGKIQATVNIDSIAQVYEKKYRNKESSDVTNISKIVTKNVIPKWAIWVMAIGAIFTFLYIREKVSIFVK